MAAHPTLASPRADTQGVTTADRPGRRRDNSRAGQAHAIVALDGVRGLAILLVLAHHLYLWQVGRGHGPWLLMALATFAFSGVLLFFVLSGFLLYLPYARASLDGGTPWPDLRRFYLRRVLRILPVHWAVLLTITVSLALFWHLRPATLRGITLTGLLVQNFDADAGRIEGILNAPLWTLAVEWQFYLVLPWLALALRWLVRRAGAPAGSRRSVMALLAGIGLLIIYGLATHAGLVALSTLPPPSGSSTLSNMVGLLIAVFTGRYFEYFGLGMLLSVLYVRFVERAEPRQPPAVLGGALALTAVAGIIGCLAWANASGFFRLSNPWDYAPASEWLWNTLGVWSLGVCYAALIAAVLIGRGLPQHIFAFRPLCFVGLISYSLYILHMPIIEFIWNTKLPAHLLTVLLVAFPLSMLSYYLIERPFMRLRLAMRDPKARLLSAATPT